ncbi:MAG: hypothetical protein V9F03_08065 [Microthrixaceae bacterium]
MNGKNLEMQRLGIRRTLLFMLMVMGLVASACTVPPQNPDGSVPQTPPMGLNGLAESTTHPGTVWAADYFGHQLLRIDPSTGEIHQRFGGLCDTDDVVQLDDGTLVATCAGAGGVIKVLPDGRSELLANVGLDVNPIVLEPGGESVIVGFGTEADDRLLRVPLDGSPVQVVATGLPVLNGFGFGPDGLLYAPTGGAASILTGTGGIIAIDVQTGAFHQLPLNFTDGDRSGFNFPSGVEVAPDGTIFVVQSTPAGLFAIDPVTFDVTAVADVPMQFLDNLVLLADGRIVVSGFLGNTIGVLSRNTTGDWDVSAVGVGS